MRLYSRHPRYTLALVCSLFFLFLILANATSSRLESARSQFLSKLPYGSPYGPSITDQIKQNDLFYQKTLKDRQKLITKNGPNVNDIQSFPERETYGIRLYTLWDFFLPTFRCPHRMERIGTPGDGGKWVCGMERLEKLKDCVVYSVGINGESSFEADILKRAPGCKVWGYDYSVQEFGPEIEDFSELKSRSHFFPYALGGVDRHEDTDNPKWYTLKTLMKENNNTFIDILKIDIEGAEFEALDDLVNAYQSTGYLPFGQLQLEIHAFSSSPYSNFPQFLTWWEKLEAIGLRAMWTEPNLVYLNLWRGNRPDLAEYSFINIRGSHAIISD